MKSTSASVRKRKIRVDSRGATFTGRLEQVSVGSTRDMKCSERTFFVAGKKERGTIETSL